MLAEWTRVSGSQIYLDEPLLRLRVLGAHLPERPADAGRCRNPTVPGCAGGGRPGRVSMPLEGRYPTPREDALGIFGLVIAIVILGMTL